MTAVVVVMVEVVVMVGSGVGVGGILKKIKGRGITSFEEAKWPSH